MPIIKQICIAMLQQVPEDWTSAYLLLEVTEKGLGAGLAHSAITRQRSAGFDPPDADWVSPGPEVIAATRELELAHIQFHYTFQRAIISANFVEGQWQIRSEYEHE